MGTELLISSIFGNRVGIKRAGAEERLDRLDPARSLPYGSHVPPTLMPNLRAVARLFDRYVVVLYDTTAVLIPMLLRGSGERRSSYNGQNRHHKEACHETRQYALHYSFTSFPVLVLSDKQNRPPAEPVLTLSSRLHHWLRLPLWVPISKGQSS